MSKILKMVLKNYMEPNVLMKQGQLVLVPASMKHVIPLAETLSSENKLELDLFDRAPTEFLIEHVKKDSVYVVEKNNIPLCITGVEPDGKQTGFMWAMFAEDMKKNWFSFLKASPDLVNFLHNDYYKLNMNVLECHESILNWAIWLGFEPEAVIKGQNIDYVHFVRCNLLKKNVYNLTSRPVIH